MGDGGFGCPFLCCLRILRPLLEQLGVLGGLVGRSVGLFLVHEGKPWENGWFGWVGGWRDRFTDVADVNGRVGEGGLPLSGVLLSLFLFPSFCLSTGNEWRWFCGCLVTFRLRGEGGGEV